ncbi:MAG: hypothetical protein R8P61_03415 [Bacteroidia bacterium]|nr:hypothetical protein [Bacteroidia bacterium]
MSYFLLFACTTPETQVQEVVWSRELIAEEVAERIARSDTLPRLPQDLQEVLPEKWEPFISTEEKTNIPLSGHMSWTEARKVYFQADRSFVEIFLMDYAADRRAVMRLYEKYEDAQRSEGNKPKVWPEEKSSVFAWNWFDQRNELHYVEAAVSSRFHILIRTNLPESRQVLESTWSKLAWKKLEEMGALN